MIIKRRRRHRTKYDFTLAWCTDPHINDDIIDNPDHPDAMAYGYMFNYPVGAFCRKFRDVANAENVDMAVITGDIVHSSPDYQWFTDNIWDQITAPNKAIALGNHDLHASTKDQVASYLGYAENPLICGSKFNYSFMLTDGDKQVKIIMVDTQSPVYFEYEGITSDYVGVCSAEQRMWILDELTNNSANMALMFMHNLPHMYYLSEPTMKEEDALGLRDVVNLAATQKPDMRVHCFAGHSPVYSRGKDDYNNLGSNFIGHIAKSLNAGQTGSIFIVSVGAQGTIKFKEVLAPYPYP